MFTLTPEAQRKLFKQLSDKLDTVLQENKALKEEIAAMETITLVMHEAFTDSLNQIKSKTDKIKE